MMQKEYKKFYEADLWQDAYGLQKEVFEQTQTFPKHERYGLGSQLNDSSNSVCGNLAEEHGRFLYGDKIRILYIVRGEMEETQSHLIVAVSRGYIKKETSVSMIGRYEKLKMKINGRISDFRVKKERD